MTINYDSLQGKATAALKSLGLPVSISRAGSKIASTYGVFIAQEQADDTRVGSSLLAQTEIANRTLLIAAIGKAPAVGDLVVADRNTFTITSIEVTRPTTTTLLYKLVIT